MSVCIDVGAGDVGPLVAHRTVGIDMTRVLGQPPVELPTHGLTPKLVLEHVIRLGGAGYVFPRRNAIKQLRRQRVRELLMGAVEQAKPSAVQQLTAWLWRADQAVDNFQLQSLSVEVHPLSECIMNANGTSSTS